MTECDVKQSWRGKRGTGSETDHMKIVVRVRKRIDCEAASFDSPLAPLSAERFRSHSSGSLSMRNRMVARTARRSIEPFSPESLAKTSQGTSNCSAISDT